MKTREIRPVILVSPSSQQVGEEMADHSVTVASLYLKAVLAAGGLPLVLPLEQDPELIRQAMEFADGVMLTGGDDIDPRIYWPEAPAELLSTCGLAEATRDVMELELIRATFEFRKPLLAICRGHQLVNVAFGGKLYVDLPTQAPGEIVHRQMDRRTEKVHDIVATPGSFLEVVTGKRRLGVNSTHHQAIETLGEPFESAAAAEDGIIEATQLRAADLGLLPWFLSVQFHPERLFDRFLEHGRIFQAFVGACHLERLRRGEGAALAGANAGR